MTHDSLWDYYDRAVSEAFSERRYAKASQIVKDALHRASVTGEFKPDLLRCADDLAKIHQQSGDYTSAASLYRLIVESQRQMLGPEHPSVQHTSRELIAALTHGGCLTPGNA